MFNYIGWGTHYFYFDINDKDNPGSWENLGHVVIGCTSKTTDSWNRFNLWAWIYRFKLKGLFWWDSPKKRRFAESHRSWYQQVFKRSRYRREKVIRGGNASGWSGKAWLSIVCADQECWSHEEDSCAGNIRPIQAVGYQEGFELDKLVCNGKGLGNLQEGSGQPEAIVKPVKVPPWPSLLFCCHLLFPPSPGLHADPSIPMETLMTPPIWILLPLSHFSRLLLSDTLTSLINDLS